ncbi:hypothetical protein AVEN_138515-1 [Araneus ventricosus]|uniref:Uncharacterized protein n=1 Tax=Araneus ventricosus TaxID=182803 RepID=A0A4Y2RJU4_ARAVE|nr:hypothetical protein AVEN_138515-1 [Araneus ventricosus]
MGDNEKEAWNSFKDVVHRVLENTKDPLYKTIVHLMLTAYEAGGCKMSLKIHFLHSHIDYFSENLRAYSKEQGESFTRMSVISSWILRDEKQKMVSESVFGGASKKRRKGFTDKKSKCVVLNIS